MIDRRKALDHTDFQESEAAGRVAIAAYSLMFILSAIACALPRLSAVALYLRVFTNMSQSRYNKYARRVSYGPVFVLVAVAIALSIPVAVEVPVWYLIESGGTLSVDTCHFIGLIPLGTWISLPHVMTDLLMLVLPLPLVWRLQAKAWKKLGLMVVFLAGGL